MRRLFIVLYCLTLITLLVTCDNLNLVNGKYYNIDISNLIKSKLDEIEFTDHVIETDYLYLPEDIGGFPISWTSSNPLLIDSRGNISNPTITEGEATIVMEASITVGGITGLKEFNFTLVPEGCSTEVITIGEVDIEMVLIEAGDFLIGSREYYHSKSYYISSRPVSEKLYNSVVYNRDGIEKNITNITFTEAMNFTNKASLISGSSITIPSEAQLFRFINNREDVGIFEFTTDTYIEGYLSYENPESRAFPGDNLLIIKSEERESVGWDYKGNNLGFRIVIPN